MARWWCWARYTLAYPSVYPLREEILTAFEAADALVVEVDIAGGNALALQQMMLTRGTYPPGESLQQHLSPAVYDQLVQYLQGRGLPLDMFSSLRPGLVVTMLTTTRMMELGLKPEYGIDQHFLQLARDDKEILQLESIEQQIELLLDFGDPDLLLEQTLVQLEGIEQYLQPLYAAWLAGDAEQLDRLIRADQVASHPEFEPVF